MMRNDMQIVPLSEPTAEDGHHNLGDSPHGFFAAKRAARTGRKIILINCGKGGMRGWQWMPGSGTGLFEQAVAKIRRALMQPDSYVAGFIQQDGMNDAVDADPSWEESWAVTWPAMRAAVEAPSAPIYGVVYPTTQPGDGAYPSYVAVRDAIINAPWFTGVAYAPEGPFRVPGVDWHLATAANVVVGGRLDALIS